MPPCNAAEGPWRGRIRRAIQLRPHRLQRLEVQVDGRRTDGATAAATRGPTLCPARAAQDEDEGRIARESYPPVRRSGRATTSPAPVHPRWTRPASDRKLGHGAGRPTAAVVGRRFRRRSVAGISVRQAFFPGDRESCRSAAAAGDDDVCPLKFLLVWTICRPVHGPACLGHGVCDMSPARFASAPCAVPIWPSAPAFSDLHG